MKEYTYSEARRRLAAILERARIDRAVRIRLRSGESFVLQPEESLRSPLIVEGIDLDLTRDEIVASVREGRADPVPTPREMRGFLQGMNNDFEREPDRL